MKITALEIAEKHNGTVEGDENILLTSLAKIQDAKKGSLSFLGHPKYNSFILSTKASAVLVSENFKTKNSDETTLIRVKDPYGTFNSLLIEKSNQIEEANTGIHDTAIIDFSAKIAGDVFIGPYVVVGAKSKICSGVRIHSHCHIGSGVNIGKDTLLHPRVSLMDKTEIGERCILNSGSIIGSDGFGFVKKNRENIKTPHLGKVIVKNDVEIGANSTIDRATLGATIIHDGVKLDNLVQIAHNVEIGSNTVIAAQSGIAGSTKIGENCLIGGQVGIIGHLVLGDNIQIQGQSGIINNIPNGTKIQGTPGFDFKSFYKSYALFKKFPDFENRLRKLEKK